MNSVDDALPVGVGPSGTFAVPNPAGNGWTNVVSQGGYKNDYTVHAARVNDGPSNFATWNIRVSPNAGGEFDLFATWVARPQNADNATYEIREGTTLRATVVADQRVSPADGTIDGVLVKKLGTFSKANPATTYFNVRLVTVGANGDVVADAVFCLPTP